MHRTQISAQPFCSPRPLAPNLQSQVLEGHFSAIAMPRGVAALACSRSRPPTPLDHPQADSSPSPPGRQQIRHPHQHHQHQRAHPEHRILEPADHAGAPPHTGHGTLRIDTQTTHSVGSLSRGLPSRRAPQIAVSGSQQYSCTIRVEFTARSGTTTVSTAITTAPATGQAGPHRSPEPPDRAPSSPPRSPPPGPAARPSAPGAHSGRRSASTSSPSPPRKTRPNPTGRPTASYPAPAGRRTRTTSANPRATTSRYARTPPGAAGNPRHRSPNERGRPESHQGGGGRHGLEPNAGPPGGLRTREYDWASYVHSTL
jgi:hypothetical protein